MGIKALLLICIEKFICYSAFATGFFGVALLPIDIGLFTLFPFRILLLLLWVLFVCQSFLVGKIRIFVAGIKPYFLFLCFWVAYAVISLIWTISKEDAIRHCTFLFMGVSVIFFALYYFRTRKDMVNLYWVWIGAFCVLLLLGFWEHLTGQHLPVSGYYGETRARFMFRPTGVFRNPNDYATFLALSVPFLLGLFRYVSRKLFCLPTLGAVVGSFYLIVINSSRANILAVMVEVGFLFLCLTRWKEKIKIIIISGLCLGLAVTLFPGPVRGLLQEVAKQLHSIKIEGEFYAGSTTIRLNLFRNGLNFLLRTAGFGVGAGNAEYWMANFAHHDTAGILNLHNWWLEVLVNYGIFVFFGYVAMYFGLLHRLWCLWHSTKDPGEKMIAEALLVTLVGFVVASISSSSIMAFHPQWLLFAFAFAYLNYRYQIRRTE